MHNEQRGSRMSCLHHTRVVVPVNQKYPSCHSQKTGTVYGRPSRRSVAITPMYGCLRKLSSISQRMRPIARLLPSTISHQPYLVTKNTASDTCAHREEFSQGSSLGVRKRAPRNGRREREGSPIEIIL